jgi:membrane peptidoglycan carboxypeptidase
MRVPPVSILRIVDSTGQIKYDYKVPAAEQVLRPEHAYLMSSILSDYDARRPMFGNSPVINLPFPAAAKTGTTNDFRDNWTMGYVPDLAVGVWVGNADYTPMQNTTGLSGAAPIWADFMQQAVQRIPGAPTPFLRTSGIADAVICSISGTKPSKWCPEQRSEIFAYDQPPLPESEDLWKETIIDTWTGDLATPACDEFVEKKMVLNVTDPSAKPWLRKNDDGRNWAEQMGFDRPVFFVPTGKCDTNSPHASLTIFDLKEDDILTDEKISIRIQAEATGAFDIWRLQFTPGSDPDDNAEWQTLAESNVPVPVREEVYVWKLKEADNGRITLRLRMENKDGGYAQRILHLKLDYTEPTPVPTEEPPTDTPTDIPPTRTPRPPTNTPVPPTDTPPTDTPPTDTPPTDTPPTDVPPTETPVPPTDTPPIDSTPTS